MEIVEKDMFFVVVPQALVSIVGRSTFMQVLQRLALAGHMALPCRLNQSSSGEGEFERELHKSSREKRENYVRPNAGTASNNCRCF